MQAIMATSFIEKEKDLHLLWGTLSHAAKRVSIEVSHYDQGRAENALKRYFEKDQIDIKKALKELESSGLVQRFRQVDLCKEILKQRPDDKDAQIIVNLYERDPDRYFYWGAERLIIAPDMESFVRQMDKAGPPDNSMSPETV